MSDRWTNQIKDSLESYTRPVPESLWERIDDRVSSRQRPRVAVNLFRRRVIAALSAAAVLAVLVTVGFFHFKPVADMDLSDRESVVPPLAAENTVMSETSEPVSRTAQLVAAEPGVTVSVGPVIAEAPREEAQGTDVSDDETMPAVAGDGNVEGAGEQVKAAPQVTERVSRDASYTGQWSDMPAIKPRRGQSSGLSLGLYASNTPGSSYGREDAARLLKSMILNDAPPVMGSDGKETMGDVTAVFVSGADQRPVTEVHHRLPVRAGLTVSYGVTQRLSVESGLSYAYLASDMSSGFDGRRYETTQHLHYLGVPVRLNYALWENRRFRFYVSGGSLMEKCVAGNSDTRYFMEGKNSKSESVRLVERPVQWSVNGAVGAQVDILPSLGLYVEPGVSYYFDNGSPVETVYKDRTLNFNLNLGLRLSLGR